MVKHPNCDLIKLYEFLGKKWTVSLLHNINKKPISYNELFRMTQSKINPTLLSNRIKDVMKYNIIEQSDCEKKRICYKITNQGLKLKKLIHKMKSWSIESGLKLSKNCGLNECVCDTIFNSK